MPGEAGSSRWGSQSLAEPCRWLGGRKVTASRGRIVLWIQQAKLNKGSRSSTDEGGRESRIDLRLTETSGYEGGSSPFHI